MAVSAEQVKRLLDSEEPDYQEAAGLGVDALPHLERLVQSGDPALASKAACLAGIIGHPSAMPILELAASSPNASVRAAAASGAKGIPSGLAEPLLIRLINDDRAGIRKVALQAVPETASDELLGVVNARRSAEPQPGVRQLASEVLNRAAARKGKPLLDLLDELRLRGVEDEPKGDADD